MKTSSELPFANIVNSARLASGTTTSAKTLVTFRSVYLMSSVHQERLGVKQSAGSKRCMGLEGRVAISAQGQGFCTSEPIRMSLSI